MKTLLTSVLVASIMLLPMKADEPQQPPQPAARAVGACVLACLVIAVGTIVVVGLKKMCDKLPQIDGPTNAPPKIHASLPLIRSGDPVITNDLETVELQFQEGTGAPWQEGFTVTFDRSMNAKVYRNGALVLEPTMQVGIDSNGTPVVTVDLSMMPLAAMQYANFRLLSR